MNEYYNGPLVVSNRELIKAAVCFWRVVSLEDQRSRMPMVIQRSTWEDKIFVMINFLIYQINEQYSTSSDCGFLFI